MAANRRYRSGQLLSFAQNSYLERTSRAVYAIIFLLPFIVFYELGTIFINTDLLNQSQIRVVAFVWLQDILEYLGFGSKFAWIAPPLAVVVILAAFQMASGKRWSICFSDLWLMAVECILLAVPLIVMSLMLNGSARSQQNSSALNFHSYAVSVCSSFAGSGASAAKQLLLPSIITGIGAGIYEELVFRLILICLLMLLFQDAFKLTHKTSIILAVLISAALFSAHHHVIFLSGTLDLSSPFNLPEFTFRTIAGVYFAVLFAVRGFGITAGTHAFYDIIAVFINAGFFPR